MDKKFPPIFIMPTNKKFNNTKMVYSSLNETIDKPKNKKNIFEEDISVEEKINLIFKDPSFIYKKKIKIVTINGAEEKTIIGKTIDSLVTLENEHIKINDILDII